MGPWNDQGRAHLAGIAAGADFRSDGPGTGGRRADPPGRPFGVRAVVHRGIFVNRDGRRFTNESAAYDQSSVARVLDAMADGSGDVAVLDGLRRTDELAARSRRPKKNVSMVKPEEYVDAGLWKTADTPRRTGRHDRRAGTESGRDGGEVSTILSGPQGGWDFGRGDEDPHQTFSGGLRCCTPSAKPPFHAAAFGVSDPQPGAVCRLPPHASWTKRAR